jgi:hypothetical protein
MMSGRGSSGRGAARLAAAGAGAAATVALAVNLRPLRSGRTWRVSTAPTDTRNTG